MSKVEKKFKNYMEKQIHVKDSYQDIVKRIDFNEKESNSMKKKKIIPITVGALSVVLVGGLCIALINRPNNEIKPKGVVSIDVNPSIELVIDDENKVMSITGMNDEGKMIILNEEIVGKSLDDAIETIITVENETGYLISGRVETGENEIKISVSADTQEIINSIKSVATQSVSDVCDQLNIKETVVEIEKYGREVLEQRVVEIDPTLEDKVKEMTHEELLDVIKLHHLETSEVYSEKLEELYVESKNYQITFSEKDSIKNLINGMEGSYQSFLTLYGQLIDSLTQYSLQLEETRYDLLIDPESSYQKAVSEVNNAKMELNALKNEVAKEESGSIFKELEVEIKEKALAAVEEALVGIDTVANTTLDGISSVLEQTITSLKEQEESFPSEIKSKLEADVKDIEVKVNETKDQAFEKFEAKYQEDILRIKEEQLARKEALKQSINNN